MVSDDTIWGEVCEEDYVRRGVGFENWNWNWIWIWRKNYLSVDHSYDGKSEKELFKRRSFVRRQEIFYVDDAYDGGVEGGRGATDRPDVFGRTTLFRVHTP